MIGVQVDYIICASTLACSNDKDVASNEFPDKENIPWVKTAVNFIGVKPSKAVGDNQTIMNQRKYIKKLRSIILY